ncbi:nuclear pore complex protein Nup107-like [Amphibalanus amphitrite]|uniref:nuclear pore complex protein Nup107-like n=1 Tax=Amphibalanus amphitrite TaxID=1232801 RepID=UPI001C929DD1|nr:nuclear pore complex protein Nup107-like [Amphibalanus amphitrite]
MDTPQPRRQQSRHSDIFERSLQRLDDALQSPSGSLQGRPRQPDRRSVLSRRSGRLDDLTMDLTSYTMVGGRRSILPGEMTALEESILEEPELTMLTEEDPGDKAVSGLSEEFLSAYRQRPSEHQLLDLLADYQQLTEQQVERLAQLVRRVPAQRGATHLTATRQLHSQLSKERNTWRLLVSLYRDRLLVTSEEPGALLLEGVGRPRSDQRLAEDLFKCQTDVRQAQLVVDWLEHCAADDIVSGYMDKVEFFGNTAVAWENTLHALQAADGRTARGQSRSMDPDGPVRDRQPLHDLDQDDERRLLRYMFVLLRSGQMSKAQELCLRVGQPWRAATLEGWKLAHDPNYEDPASEPRPVQGNPLRDLWKLTAWQLSEDVSYDEHERAVYGALCGNLDALLPVCSTWEDRVWAFFKVFVDSRVEADVRENSQSLRQLRPLPQHYTEKSRSPDAIFSEVDALENSSGRTDEAVRLYNAIQQCAILGDEATMCAKMAAFCKEDGGNDQLLRSLAHIVLLVRQYGSTEVDHDHCVTVLEAYVKRLVSRQEAPLAVWYTALLPPPLQTEWCAALMESARAPADRLRTLRLAEEAGLDAPAAALAVVRAARLPAEPAAELSAETSEDDRRAAGAIQWLLFEPAQRLDALREGNAICRRLLLARKLPAARELMQLIPDDSIAVLLARWKETTGETELPPEQDNVVKEHLCVKAFMLGQDAYQDWSDQFYSQRPRRPELRPAASFAETVAHEQRLKQYETALERWRAAHTAATAATAERLYNVLLFPDGGWMADRAAPHTAAAPEGAGEPQRQRELAQLRRLYVPQTVCVLHTVLTESGRLPEAARLADLVAGDEYQLYKEFSQPELQNLLGKLRETSLRLLDQNLDALGYPFQ